MVMLVLQSINSLTGKSGGYGQIEFDCCEALPQFITSGKRPFSASFQPMPLPVIVSRVSPRGPVPPSPHPTPDTLHPTLCTLHLTPYTLYPTPYTLHPTAYNQNPQPYTLHPTPYTLQPSPCTLHLEPSTLHPTP